MQIPRRPPSETASTLILQILNGLDSYFSLLAAYSSSSISLFAEETLE